MKEREYTEGPKALENFERGMTALFKVPKAAIVPLKKAREDPFFRAQSEEGGQGLEGDL